MRIRTMMMATASLAVVACVGGAVSAQDMSNSLAAKLPTATPGGGETRHLVYAAMPGGPASPQYGVLVFDADHDFRFVKRIPYDLPAAKIPGPYVTGITASVPEQKIYITVDDRMMAIDTTSDKLVWSFNGDPGGVRVIRRGAAETGCCERPWTLPGGETLLVAASYNNWWYYVDAKTGKSLGKVMLTDMSFSHNMGVSEDGKIAFLTGISGPVQGAGLAGAAVVDVPNRKVLRYVHFDNAPRPMTINYDGSLAYVNVDGLDGFDIVDTAAGKVIKRVELPGDMWKAKWAQPDHRHFGHGTPSHGIGMTPDQSEIWVVDSANDAFQVWDNPGDGRNPVYNPMKTVPQMNPKEDASWISMSNDGKTAILGDGTIVDVKNHKGIGVLKDEYGHPVGFTEKVLFLTFKDGKMIETSNQFSPGYSKPTQARIAAEASGANKQAAN